MDFGQSTSNMYVFSVCCLLALSSAHPRINTTSGIVEGYTRSVHIGNQTKMISTFLGIPYGEPPVGEMRFRKPIPKTRIPGVINATNYGPMCPQNSSWTKSLQDMYPPSAFAVSESCLVLNVYCPGNNTESAPKAVMVWIHGGSYLTGSGNVFDGTQIAARGDVVVVNINYRLGVLGFLVTTGNLSRGNYGLWDQQLALTWVKNNIAKFGGDPSNITVFGESAGAASVSLLTLSPHTKQLFNRVIIESGAALTNWAVVKDPTKYTVTFAALVGFGSEASNPQELLNILRNLSAADIISNQSYVEYVKGTYAGLWFGPVIDDDFIPNDPQDVATKMAPADVVEKFASVDHIIGTNSQEGAWIYDLRMTEYRVKRHINDSETGLPEDLFLKFVNGSAYMLTATHFRTLTTAIAYRYTDFTDQNNGIRRAVKYIEGVTDSSFYSGIIPTARFHASAINASGKDTSSNTFFYYYDHRGSWESKAPWRVGADHGDEIRFVFGYPFLVPNIPDAEKELSSTIITFWTNFAKSGNPNYPSDSGYPVEWPKYQVGEESYIRLTTKSKTNSYIGEKLAADRIAFWTDFVPKFNASFSRPPPCPVVPLGPTNGATPVTVHGVHFTILSIFLMFRHFM